MQLRMIIRILLAISLSIISQMTMATCVTKATINANYAPGTLTVQRDAPVGMVINKKTITIDTSIIMFHCQGSSHIYYKMVYQGGVKTAMEDVYQTNVPGVGLKIQGYTYGGSLFTFTNPPWDRVRNDTPVSADISSGNLEVSIIKIGDITSGVMNAGLMTTVYPDTNDGFGLKLNSSDVPIVQVACAIKTPTLTFPIGNVLVNKFGSTVGTIPDGGQNTQNLGLDCDKDANINVSLSGTQNPDVSTKTVLALSGQGDEGVAKGVGVQMLYNGTPLELDKRIVLKKSAGGVETFPLTARYYQTKTQVETGSANAVATLTLTYQ